MFGLDIQWWYILGASTIIVFLVFFRPLKKSVLWAWYGVLYSIVGGLVLFVINALGQYVHLHIPINVVTAFIAGVLGIPGIMSLVIVKLVFLG